MKDALEQLGETFERNVPIGPWLVDFYLPLRRLVLECDGAYWHSRRRAAARDRQKNWWMRTNGYHLLRLVNDRAIHHDPVGLVRLSLSALL